MIPNTTLKNKCVLIENPTSQEKVLNSGLILPKPRKPEKTSISKVLDVADDCQEVSVGDVVYFEKALFETIDDDEQGDAKYLIVKEHNIYFKVHD